MTEHEPELPDFESIPDPGAKSAPLPPRPRPVLSSRGPTRRDLTHGRRIALLVSAGWIGAQLAASGLRGDLARVPLGYTFGFAVVPVVAGLVCLIAATTPGRLGLGARVTVLATLALALPATFAVVSYVFSPPYAGAPAGEFKYGVLCFNVALAWTLLPLIAAGIALRGTFVTRATLRSALVGAAAGLVVSATSMLRCPLSDSWHMALSHGGAVIAAALFGATVLARVTRV
ncbi:MAG TPA: NrsF family protein [Polyangiaceae bacterium]|nr:NrsF family protein [Polyangiaceae bacterium]